MKKTSDYFLSQQYGAKGLDGGLALRSSSANSLAIYSSTMADRSQRVVDALRQHIPHKELLKTFTIKEPRMHWFSKMCYEGLASIGLATYVDTSPKSIHDVLANVEPVIRDQIGLLKQDLSTISHQIQRTDRCASDMQRTFKEEVVSYQKALDSLRRIEQDSPDLESHIAEIEKQLVAVDETSPQFLAILLELSDLRIQHEGQHPRRESLQCSVGRHKMSYNRAQNDLIQLELDKQCLERLNQVGTYVIDDLERISKLVPLTYQSLCTSQQLLHQASQATTKIDFGEKLGYCITQLQQRHIKDMPIPEYSGAYGKHDIRAS